MVCIGGARQVWNGKAGCDSGSARWAGLVDCGKARHGLARSGRI